MMLTEIKQKSGYVGYNKNYAILALNCTLKNSKEIISPLGIKRRCRKNNIKKE